MIALRTLTVISSSLLLISISASASPNERGAAKGNGGGGSSNGKVTSAVEAIKNANKKLSDARQKLGRVSNDDLDRVLDRLSTSSDSDDDGLPDILELALQTQVCDSDSDNDGISDGDEVVLGNSPKDDDFDDDDNDGETEVTGTISSISSSSVTLGGTTFAIVESTRFLDRDKNPLTISDFNVGTCAEAEGYTRDGVLRAAKLKQKNSDDC